MHQLERTVQASRGELDDPAPFAWVEEDNLSGARIGALLVLLSSLSVVGLLYWLL